MTESATMRYVSSVKRIGIRKGLEKGLQQELSSERRTLLRLIRHRFGEIAADLSAPSLMATWLA